MDQSSIRYDHTTALIRTIVQPISLHARFDADQCLYFQREANVLGEAMKLRDYSLHSRSKVPSL